MRVTKYSSVLMTYRRTGFHCEVLLIAIARVCNKRKSKENLCKQ